MLRAVLITPLSGELGGYGRAGAIALRLWADWHNRRFAPKVELFVVDASPDPVAALTGAELTSPGLLFGPYGSGPMAAVAAATSRLVWNHGGARVPAAANLVPVLAPADTYFHGAIRAVKQADRNASSVCILAGGTGFGQAVAGGAAREAGRLGLRVTEARLGAAAEPADLLLAAGRFAEEAAAARRLLPGGRWRAAGFVAAGVEEVLAGLGGEREGLLGPAQWLAETAPVPDEGPSAAEFAAAYRYRAGADPPYPAAQAFAAGVIASRCLREAGTADDAALAAAACALECTTMFARFRLDPRMRRQVGHRVLTVQWQDGVRRVIWPPEQAQARLRYPLPRRPRVPGALPGRHVRRLLGRFAALPDRTPACGLWPGRRLRPRQAGRRAGRPRAAAAVVNLLVSGWSAAEDDENVTVATECSDTGVAGRLWECVQPEAARRLLVAGLGLFAAQGFHGTTTRDIAARAGMSPAALYVHYRTKEHLLFQISRIAHEAALATIPPQPPGPPDPAGQLRAAVAAFATWHAHHHTAARVAQYELAALEPAHFRAVAAVRLAIERNFRKMIERGVTVGQFEVSDIPATALAVLSLAIDLARWYQPGSRHTPEELGELYAALALRMVGSER